MRHYCWSVGPVLAVTKLAGYELRNYKSREEEDTHESTLSQRGALPRGNWASSGLPRAGSQVSNESDEWPAFPAGIFWVFYSAQVYALLRVHL
jgi:hypothetical protein